MDRMTPGALCGAGFLGDDRRGLQEILDADAGAVARLGLTHDRLAGRLGEILEQAVAALGRPVVINDHLSAVFREAMGRIPCPWGGCGLFAKGEVVATDSRTGATLRFTPLSVHFVAAHGFYQGRGSPYRLGPAGLAEMLDIPAAPG